MPGSKPGKNAMENWRVTPYRNALSCLATALYQEKITGVAFKAWVVKHIPWWHDYMEHSHTTMEAFSNRGDKGLRGLKSTRYASEHPWNSETKQPYWGLGVHMARNPKLWTKEEFEEAVRKVQTNVEPVLL